LVDTALFENICPRKMVRKTDGKDNSGNFMLKPLKRTANLRIIKYCVPESIFFRMLLCKEYISAFDPDVCQCSEYKNEAAGEKICESGKKVAHIYFRFENQKKADEGPRSCIIIFFKAGKNPDELVQRLKDTVTQLGIGEEKFDFHVVPFCYEKITLNMLNRNKLNKEIKTCYVGSQLKIRDSIQMNENNDLMILKISHDKEVNEFLINPIVEDRESL